MATKLQRTNVPNLDYDAAYKKYFGRVKVNGKVVREYLGQNKQAAESKLVAWLVSKRGAVRTVGGTLNALTERYLIRLQGKVDTADLNPETSLYKRDCLNAVRKNWPEFSSTNLSKLTPAIMEKFRVIYRGKYSATRTNGSITVLRELLELAVEEGHLSEAAKSELLKKLVYVKVDYDYQRMTLELPDKAGVVALRNCVQTRCMKNQSEGYWLFDFLLLSGSRIEAANDVRWCDISWGKQVDGKWIGHSLFFGNAKYGNYSIPIFPELRKLLEDLRKRFPNAKPNDRILPTKSLQAVLTSACKEIAANGVKCSHLSHHDLRHIFATSAIEQGIDWVTLASWLGHNDNGRTAMLVYGHLRREHSDAQAAKMQFLPPVATVPVTDPIK